jgi:hypothetical protein
MTTPTTTNPVVLDKGCYWLICIPIPPDEVGWNWRCLVWVKGDDREKTALFKRTVGECEAAAARFMKC